jgi:chromosome segregation ATPase
MERVQEREAEIARLVAVHRDEIERLTGERDRAIESWEDSQEEIRLLEREAGRLEGELEQLRKKRRGLFGLGG